MENEKPESKTFKMDNETLRAKFSKYKIKTWKQKFQNGKRKTWEHIFRTENKNLIAKFPQRILKKLRTKFLKNLRARGKKGRGRGGRREEQRPGPVQLKHLLKNHFCPIFDVCSLFFVSWYLLGSGLARGRQWQRQWEGPKKMPATRKHDLKKNFWNQ